MSTKAVWRNGILTFIDGTTHERVGPQAPLVFADDFVGADLVIPAAGSDESGCKWVKKIVGAAPPTVAKVANAANGTIGCALTADNQKQDALLYMDDQRSFSIEQGLIFEARVRLTTLPTLLAEAYIGIIGDWADGPDAITYSAFFTQDASDGSGLVFCEVDDNATDTAVTSGVTVTAAQWRIYRIDFSDVTDIKFYIDGVSVATGTTFPYAATGANAVLQPAVGLYKSTGAGLGVLQVDYVRLYQKRN